MSTRPDKPKEYFATLLGIPEEQIDHYEIPATTRGDWEEAEILFPVTSEEFRAIKQFILRRRRMQASGAMRSPA